MGISCHCILTVCPKYEVAYTRCGPIYLFVSITGVCHQLTYTSISMLETLCLRSVSSKLQFNLSYTLSVGRHISEPQWTVPLAQRLLVAANAAPPQSSYNPILIRRNTTDPKSATRNYTRVEHTLQASGAKFRNR